MGDFLTAINTTVTKKKPVELAKPESISDNRPRVSSARSTNSASDVLDVLKAQPSYEDLERVFYFLTRATHPNDEISIRIPGPLSTQVLNVLVRTIIPDFWTILKNSDETHQLRKSIVECLQSIPGVGALVAALKDLIAQSGQKQDAAKRNNLLQRIEDLLQVLSQVIDSKGLSYNVWRGIQCSSLSEGKQSILWTEYVNLVASSKVLSVSAAAENALKSTEITHEELWIASGSTFSSWLGAEIAHFALEVGQDDSGAWNALATLWGKALSLGHNDRLIASILDGMSLKHPSLAPKTAQLIKCLPFHRQQTFFNLSISVISAVCMKSSSMNNSAFLKVNSSRDVDAMASFLDGLVEGNDRLKDYIVDGLTGAFASFTSTRIEIKRALLTVVFEDNDRMGRLLEKSIELFGDQLFIKHSPILQQEALAQVLLMAAGYVHRQQPTLFHLLARSTAQTQGVSNRLGASSSRARILGMLVATGVSSLIDKPGSQLKFDIEDLETPESKWYLQLVNVNDKIGNIEDLIKLRRNTVAQALPRNRTTTLPLQPKKPSKTSTAAKKPAQQQQSKVVQVLDSDDDDDDADLAPYAKPDSDREDSDDDPTLVRRADKPKAPVYIRDLVAGLRETTDYDKHFLALSTAAPLIRRKANFGNEVKDNLDELATLLIGMSDQFEIENAQEMRQRALIAVVLTEPERMGPWLAESFFAGDYSVSQRVAILTATGLGARELAGFKEDGDHNAASGGQKPFPSKMLPDHLHQLYADDTSPSAAVNTITQRMERKMMEPMALKAADQLTGPNVLKVRTFSSRMEVEKKRHKPIPNALAKVVAQSFFFPLTGRWWTHTQAVGSHSHNNNIVSSNHVLPLFLKTLAIVIQAAGPSTLSLPQMTSEFWDLLLPLRAHATSNNDVALLEALLFAFLVLLEVNEDSHRRLAQEHSRELLETQEWVRLVYERFEEGVAAGKDGKRDGEGERVRMLAAGVLVRTGDVVQKYRRMMLGDLVDL